MPTFDHTALIIITQAPGNSPESIELALAAAAFEQSVALVFTGLGTQWLNTNQLAQKQGGKNPANLIKALPMYDIEHIYYLSSKNTTDKTANANPIDGKALQTLIHTSQHCLVF